MRRTYAWAGACALLILAVVLVAVLATRDDEDTGGLTATSTTSGAVVTSPYDFTEADAPVEISRFADAKFISLTVATPAGVKSYLLAHDSAGFATLIAALAGARKTADRTTTSGRTGAAEGEKAGTGEEAIGSSLTVVMADRTTYTFAFDVAGDVIVRGSQTWRLQSDLKTLVERATAE